MIFSLKILRENSDRIHMFFFERQIWITDGSLEYHCATSRTIRSYPSPLGNNAYTTIQEETQ
ncbi:hypothetical protein Hanom_Chr06g00577221 [Helianthus anomalus]